MRIAAPGSTRAGGHARASDWIALGDASTLLGVSAATLRRWSDDGRIPVFTTPGGHRRYSRRALAALIPSARRERLPLTRLGASAERITRAYRAVSRASSRVRGPVVPEWPWMDRLSEPEMEEFRLQGRVLVEALLRYLEHSPDGGGEDLERAAAAAAGHGRLMARLGCSTVEAVETFLWFRAPFLDQLSRLASRRGLDAREATALLADVERALDRLLVATIEGHAGATTVVQDAAGAGDVRGRQGEGGSDPMRR